MFIHVAAVDEQRMQSSLISMSNRRQSNSVSSLCRFPACSHIKLLTRFIIFRLILLPSFGPTISFHLPILSLFLSQLPTRCSTFLILSTRSIFLNQIFLSRPLHTLLTDSFLWCKARIYHSLCINRSDIRSPLHFKLSGGGIDLFSFSLSLQVGGKLFGKTTNS